jgi:hypothetical protein
VEHIDPNVGSRIDLEVSVDLSRQEMRGDAPKRRFELASRLDLILGLAAAGFLIFLVLVWFAF